jgi:hypothetical protein
MGIHGVGSSYGPSGFGDQPTDQTNSMMVFSAITACTTYSSMGLNNEAENAWAWLEALQKAGGVHDPTAEAALNAFLSKQPMPPSSGLNPGVQDWWQGQLSNGLQSSSGTVNLNDWIDQNENAFNPSALSIDQQDQFATYQDLLALQVENSNVAEIQSDLDPFFSGTGAYNVNKTSSAAASIIYDIWKANGKPTYGSSNWTQFSNEANTFISNLQSRASSGGANTQAFITQLKGVVENIQYNTWPQPSGAPLYQNLDDYLSSFSSYDSTATFWSSNWDVDIKGMQYIHGQMEAFQQLINQGLPPDQLVAQVKQFTQNLDSTLHSTYINLYNDQSLLNDLHQALAPFVLPTPRMPLSGTTAISLLDPGSSSGTMNLNWWTSEYLSNLPNVLYSNTSGQFPWLPPYPDDKDFAQWVNNINLAPSPASYTYNGITITVSHDIGSNICKISFSGDVPYSELQDGGSSNPAFQSFMSKYFPS